MNTVNSYKERSFAIPIVVVSVLIVLVVFALFYLVPHPALNLNLKILPAINASLNFSTAILLLLGRYFIIKKQIKLHKNTMITAFFLSAIFLVCYVVYHALAPETKFKGPDWMKFYIYFPILFSHIILAAFILPMILFTMTRGLQERFDKHRKIAVWTWPLWLYVAVTGVLVYIMLSPYY